jgi:hypothetical protein
MFGFVKPVDAFKHLGAILGVVIVLMLTTGILVCAWSGMSSWQRLGLVAIGFTVWNLLRPRRRTRNAKQD